MLVDGAIDGPVDAASSDAPDAHPPYADPFGPLAMMPGTCSSDQWCWMAPRPAGNSYDHEFATAPDNVWLIGGNGVAIQWDGVQWHDRTPPTIPPMNTWELAFSISGLAPNDMWLALDSTMQHWDGTAWTIVDSGYRFGNVWESPKGEVWCTLLGGDSVWHLVPGMPAQLVGIAGAGNVWGLSADDFWVMATSSIVHYQSGQFTTAYGGTDILGMVGGAALDDMWFGGGNVLVHYANGTFTRMTTGLANNTFINFAGASSTSDVSFWSNGSIVHWDGTALTTTPVTPNAVGGEARIIGGTWWLAGLDGGVATISGTTEQVIVDPDGWNLRPLWGSKGTDMYWASTEYPTVNQVRHWDGSQWTELPVYANALDGTHSAAGNELFGGQAGALLHYDGATWTSTQPEPGSPRVFNKVWATGSGEAIAIGSMGFAYRYTAGAWTLITPPTNDDLLNIWGPDADHAWITTSANTVLVWDRANPGVLTPDPLFPGAGTDMFSAMHGADGIAWIGISNDAAIWRGTSAGWTRGSSGFTIVSSVWATSATDVVTAATGSAYLTRYDGTTWVRENINSWYAVGRYLYRPPGGPMYLVENQDVLVHP